MLKHTRLDPARRRNIARIAREMCEVARIATQKADDAIARGAYDQVQA